jgi:hypothetical protein
MALLAGDVINHARDMHPALSVVNAPAVVGYRAISRFQGDLVEQIAARQPGFLAETLTVALPLATFASGINLTTLITSGWLALEDMFARLTSDSDTTRWPLRCENVPWGQRDMAQPWPAFTMRNDVLYLLGTETDWSVMSSLRISYTAQPADVTQDSSALVVPLDARETLATSLCAFYLSRLVSEPTHRVTSEMASVWDTKADTERSRFLGRIGRTGQKQRFRVRNVMGY